MMNLYFEHVYGQLYEAHEKAVAQTFVFENDYGKMSNLFLKREIPIRFDDQTYYDITTPYGYGGPVILHSTNEEKLIEAYQLAFSSYCFEQRIVSEFIRFHPLENDNVRRGLRAEIAYVGEQVIRDLKQPMGQNMSKHMLKLYRSNLRKGMTVRFDETGDYLDDFLAIYNETMDRHQANDYYYFNRSFFETIHQRLKGHFVYVHVLLEGEVLSSGLLLYDDTYAYGYLGGTKESAYYLSPNVNCEIEGMNWMKEKNVPYYLMGGGYEKNDGIYQFKKKFAKDRVDHFYVGKVIHMPEVYDQLVQAKFNRPANQVTPSFFPAYRGEEPADTPVTLPQVEADAVS